MGALSSGLLKFTTNAELMAQEQAAKQAAEEANNKPMLTGLAAYVHRCWEAARTAKEPITQRLLQAQRARMGIYEPHVEAEIKEFGGSEEYARISSNKCRIAEAWLKDIYLGQTEKPWTCKATPSPSLPPDVIDGLKQAVGGQLAQYFAMTGRMPPPAEVRVVMEQMRDEELRKIDQAARDTAARMERKIEDQMAEGGFHPEFSKFLSDITTYPAAHFKSLELRKKNKIVWSNASGAWAPTISEEVTPFFERVDPFRAFPAPGVTSPQEGYFIEWLEYSRDDIYRLIGVPGFSEDAIRAVLDEYGRGGLINWTGLSGITESNQITDNGDIRNSPAAFIDCLKFVGPVRGQDLIDWGAEDGTVDDPARDYEAIVWIIGSWVIKAQLNPDPLGRRNYYKSSYEEVPGAYWGLGLIDLLSDVQGVVNAALRALVNNMGIASGPMVGVNVDRLPAGEDITNLHAWKIFQYGDSEFGEGGDPIKFFQPQSNVGEILTVIKDMYQMADDFSMVPRYMGGNSDIAGGVGRTASGMSMLMNAANKGMKGVVNGIDINVLGPMLENQYNFNMLYVDDPTIKGDTQVVARGAVSLMQLESLQLRRNEFLTATANPVDMQIMGIEGRAPVLREVAKGLELNVDDIVPKPQVLAQRAQQQAAMAQTGTPPGPNKEMLSTGQATTDNFSPT
jgi:hypothetical protein